MIRAWPRVSVRRTCQALVVGSLLASPLAMAHPHGWIDMSVRVITNDDGAVTGLHQTWRMDPFYSLVVMEELQQVPGTSLEQGLDQLGSEIRNNLTPQHYFTEVRIGDKPQTFGEVTEYTALERDGRLTFMFILPLTSPQPLSGQVLEYQVFDPTYYIEMVHEEEGDEPSPQALILNGEPDCTLSVLPADPDPEKVLQASLLDVDEEGEPGLGRHFAETGRVDCR
ncbi:membrane protein [Vreelandella aquamarina]|uniref:ABC-type uncharacterized transport system, substrate-binding protein n=1 Tax=Vreelandella aquamarina TaxID=77097 RepID=A0A1N6DHW7_9GAMM|nr:DUF1007 family protein [Halomonas meridiana]SEN46551.1 ABC-type uncharacterized transport system, substrate-binding protein [Halomonas aquamarina]SIN62942.1 ABC-type uncharacterized transport system, substrate-binding protein [Halomonas meridiana]SIN70317.1 ABC-type uncharacterized transport system, substrate-binding protein [Halomonas meridiana]SIO45023.1 ABC-type uncharacterized transport system, substrate-binding protein [Halomonas meridiana]